MSKTMRNLRHLPHLVLALAMTLAALALLAPRETGQAQGSGVTVTPNRDEIYVRIAPAIGREVVGVLTYGQGVTATGRYTTTRRGDWYRIDYFGAEGWVHEDVVVVIGNVNSLPLADPTTEPFDLGDGPRAGPSAATGPATIRLPESGIRFRAGPSDAYFLIGNVPRFEVLAATGRSPDGAWLQVNFRGTLGWIANLGDTFIEWQAGNINLLPAWGIVADGPPGNQPEIGPWATRDAIMTAMLLHIDLSINRLDIVSGVWSSIQRGARQLCIVSLGNPQPYIPRDQDLSAYPELDPVIAALNEGLEETGRAIELWEQWCDFQENNYPGGDLLIAPALEAVRNARRGYESARAQIFNLGLVPTPTPIPPALTPWPQVPTVTAPPQLPDLMAFGLEGNRVVFTSQFTHPELGCNWQGIGGQITGMNGQPLLGYTIRLEGVTDPTLILTTVSGGATAYGPSGWEIKVADAPNTHVFRVTIYQDERRVSDPKLVAFSGECSRNLGIMNFNQLTPLE